MLLCVFPKEEAINQKGRRNYAVVKANDITKDKLSSKTHL